MSFMKEVKNEIFGSRKSYLNEVFKKHKLAYADGIFVVTCRARINSDKKTRYLILIENQKQKKNLYIRIKGLVYGSTGFEFDNINGE